MPVVGGDHRCEDQRGIAAEAVTNKVHWMATVPRREKWTPSVVVPEAVVTVRTRVVVAVITANAQKLREGFTRPVVVRGCNTHVDRDDRS